jgi:hypothetical protein
VRYDPTRRQVDGRDARTANHLRSNLGKSRPKARPWLGRSEHLRRRRQANRLWLVVGGSSAFVVPHRCITSDPSIRSITLGRACSRATEATRSPMSERLPGSSPPARANDANSTLTPHHAGDLSMVSSILVWGVERRSWSTHCSDDLSHFCASIGRLFAGSREKSLRPRSNLPEGRPSSIGQCGDRTTTAEQI